MAQEPKRRRKKRRRKSSSGPVLILALVLLAVAGGIVYAVTRMAPPAAAPEAPAGPTAGAPAVRAESPADHSAPVPTETPVWSRDVVISEICPKNEGTLTDADGEFSDWIELENTGADIVSLKGWFLSDKEEQLYLWPFPDVSLAPGEQLLVFASGKDRMGEELHTSFSLSEGETVTLSTPAQDPVSSVTISSLPEGYSLSRSGDGTWSSVSFSTPGRPNTAAGYEAAQLAMECASPLQIWEVVVYEAKKNDWVELKNVSGESVSLDGWYITDSLKKAEKYQPLSGTLAPGALTVAECTAFSLSAQTDTLYLTRADGSVADAVFLHDIPSGGSLGRRDGTNGFFYFTSSTRGTENGSGWRMVAAQPVSDVAAGVYNEADSLTVTLSGENVHYTLDCSTPTADSPVWTGPLTITGTTILRAAAFPEGQLPSETATFSFFLRENSSLPIVSLVTDRENLFGPKGVYSQNNLAYVNEKAKTEKWERPASVSFFEEGGGFVMDCGIQTHGRLSRTQHAKRSLKLEFKGRYDGELNYDVFGDGKVTGFSSLLLRGSLQDINGAYIADNLFADMAMDFTAVPAQNYRYAALYLNGEYWGLYAIREHHSEEYFASHYNVSADSVQVHNGEYRVNGTAFNDLLTYAESHNLSDPAAWQYLQEHLDVNEMIDWLILECWSGDIDVYENVRFYSSPEYKNGSVIYGLVDMDLTMTNHQTYAVGFECWPQLHAIIPRALLQNGEFKNAFLTRLGSLLQNELGDDQVIARIEKLRTIAGNEAARDLARWNLAANTFDANVERLIGFATGRAREMASSARGYFGLTQDQAVMYFGPLA